MPVGMLTSQETSVLRYMHCVIYCHAAPPRSIVVVAQDAQAAVVAPFTRLYEVTATCGG